MNHDEILQAAKEAGCNVKTDGFITYRDEPVGNMLERFAAIIEKRTIERCAVAAESAIVPSFYQDDAKCIGLTHRPTKAACAAAIRKLGEQ